jgi:DNA-binding MarR family transcriptional regulator
MTVEPAPGEIGELLQEFVNRVSHLQGKTLAVLTEESVTLQQVLLLRRVEQLGKCTPSDIAERMHMSLPAVSQMIDRLFLLGLLMRNEALGDRRKKDVAVTPKGHALLERIRRARSAEYEAGVASLSHKLHSDLAKLLRKALAVLPEESGPSHRLEVEAQSRVVTLDSGRLGCSIRRAGSTWRLQHPRASAFR